MSAMFKRNVLPLIALPIIVCLAHGPSLGAGFELADDHTLIRISNASRVHQQVPERASLPDSIYHEAVGRGRLMPLTLAWFYLRTDLFGNAPFPAHLVNLFIACLASLLFYFVGRKAFGKHIYGFLFSTLLMICPAAGDVWPHLCRGEFLGLAFLSMTMLCAIQAATTTRPAMVDALGIAAFLAAGMAKEPFFLMTPAIVWLRISSANTQLDERTGLLNNCVRPGPIGYAATGIFSCIIIAAVAFIAGQQSHGGQSMHLSTHQIMQVTFGRTGILFTVLTNGVWLIPVMLAIAARVFAKAPFTQSERAGLIFVALVIVPQCLIYATRPYFELRYAFPMLIGIAWLNVMAVRSLFETSTQRSVLCLTIIVVSAWSLRSLQIQTTENLNLWGDTRAICRMVTDVVNNVPEHGTVVIVAPKKTEVAAALVHQLGIFGRPRTSVYLYQPDGTDGDTEFCFSEKTDLTGLSPEDVDAVIFLPHVDRSRVEERPWYAPSRLKHCSSMWQRVYVSISRGQVVSEGQKIDYDLKSTLK
jgi:hypothetical protein